jgi:rare lipoprotein A
MEVALNQRETPILAAPSTPVQAESLPPVQVASVESAPLPPVAGHYSQQGNFLPDPIVTQRAITKTNIYVQAGAFGQEQNAIRLSQKLSSIGNSHVYRADVGGQSFYRVRLGPFQSVDEADRALSLVLAKDTPKAMIVVD